MSYEDSDNSLLQIAVIAAVVAAAAFSWFYFSGNAEPDVTPVPEPVVEAEPAPVDDRPEFPLAPAMPDRSSPESLTPLPALDESDQYFELELSGVLGPCGR